MNIHLDIFKIILMNVIVFCTLVLSIEYSYRVWRYFRTYAYSYHTLYLTELSAFDTAGNAGGDTERSVYEFMAPDPITGWSPGGDGTFVIRHPGWNNATITIRQGVRVNPNLAAMSAEDAILAIGDSMVFGDQVSDDETWPSILERRLNRRVVNGGVSGYGTAQAVLRAEHLLKAERYSLVILSILVNEDLARDRTVDNNRPAVIWDHGKLRQTSVEESRSVISGNFVCSPWIPKLFFWSHIAKRFDDSHCVIRPHPGAATVAEILEFAVKRLASFPANKAILLQYKHLSFEGTREGTWMRQLFDRLLASPRDIDEVQMIRETAKRHGVPVIDTYPVLKNKPPHEIFLYRPWWPHHSARGNEVVAEVIAREIAVLGLISAPTSGSPRNGRAEKR